MSNGLAENSTIPGLLSTLGDKIHNEYHLLRLDQYDSIFETLLQFLAQLSVQQSLRTTERLLKDTPFKEVLPDQKAHRVGNLIRFLSKDDKSEQATRCKSLRSLGRNPLIFVAITYTVRELFALDDVEFKELMKLVSHHLAHFVDARLLYRKDINKAVTGANSDGPHGEWYMSLWTGHVAQRVDSSANERTHSDQMDTQAYPPSLLQSVNPSAGQQVPGSSSNGHGDSLHSFQSNHPPQHWLQSNRKRTFLEILDDPAQTLSSSDAANAATHERGSFDEGPGNVFHMRSEDAR